MKFSLLPSRGIIDGTEETLLVSGTSYRGTLHSVKTWILNGLTVTWSQLSDPPATYPPDAHAHQPAEIDGLVARLEALEAGSGGGASVPSGLIAAWWAETPPAGWVLADGHATTAAEPTLAAIFGENVPDLNSGKFLMGAGGIYTLQSTGGAATVTLTVDQMPAHNHVMKRSLAGGAGSNQWVIWDGGSDPSQTTNLTGGGQSHENLPPYVAINWIIKL